MRRALAATLALLALSAGALCASLDPTPLPTEDSLMSCSQYPHQDGSCTTICYFRDAKGEPAGYVMYDWC